MRHGNHNRKFGLKRGKRRALLVSLSSALIKNGKMTTTEAKAKEVRPFTEKLITKARTKNLANIRLLSSRLKSKTLAMALVNEIAPKFVGRAGGYTRIIKLPRRKSDGAKMAIIEFV
ncbi:MAG: 50S ribosomal protein L17 [bacterium]|nr:50S ribosomal protein L17 [bacterium]